MADYAVTEAGFAFDLGGEKFFDLKCRVGGFQPGGDRAGRDGPGTQDARRRRARCPEGIRSGGRRARTRKPGRPPRQRRPLRQADGRRHQPVRIRHARRDQGRARLLCRPRRALLRPPMSSAPAAAGRSIWPRRWSRPRPSPRRRSSRFTRSTGRPNGRSSRSPASCTARPTSTSCRPRPPRSERRTSSATASCRSAWPRRKTRSPTTPSCAAGRGAFTLTVRDVEIAAGAGFLVALTGDIVRMPGLPERPAAERIDVDSQGRIVGLS